MWGTQKVNKIQTLPSRNSHLVEAELGLEYSTLEARINSKVYESPEREEHLPQLGGDENQGGLPVGGHAELNEQQ